MGGRGSTSQSGTSGTPVSVGTGVLMVGDAHPLPTAGLTAFSERGRKTSVAATLNKQEKRIAGLKHEELIMTDENGFAVGYFKGDGGSVGFNIPKTGREKMDTSKLTLTHNHPLGDGRKTGGTFSFADMHNHIALGFKETRATALEGTYSFSAGRGANAKGMQKALNSYDSDVSAAVKLAVSKGDKRATIDITLEKANNWIKNTAPKYGYRYTYTPTVYSDGGYI